MTDTHLSRPTKAYPLEDIRKTLDKLIIDILLIDSGLIFRMQEQGSAPTLKVLSQKQKLSTDDGIIGTKRGMFDYWFRGLELHIKLIHPEASVFSDEEHQTVVGWVEREYTRVFAEACWTYMLGKLDTQYPSEKSAGYRAAFDAASSIVEEINTFFQ